MKILILLMLVSVMADQLSSYGNGDEHLFPAVHPNCTQSLTELLLLRQEIQLTKMAAAEESTTRLLQEVRDSLSEISSKMQSSGRQNSSVCDAPFTQVGDKCQLLALTDIVTWTSGRQFCAARGADLAHFADANAFAASLEYINSINFSRRKVCIWVGGSDEAVEDTWVWVTGELMPRGPPFWGSIDRFVLQPTGGRPENCAVLWHDDHYYLHDYSCTQKCALLCQK